MEDIHKSISPSTDEGFWASPMDPYAGHMRKERGLLVSTPNLAPWKSLSLSLEDSEGSARQDSGYCSLTPSSTASLLDGELFNKKCPWCSKMSRENYEPSPPQSICNCKKKFLQRKRSYNLEYLQTISETKSSSDKFLCRGRANAACDLFDEAMDTSLYPDELEVGNHPSEGHGCLVDPMEIGDEKSIDFIDSSSYLSKNTSSDSGIIKEEESVDKESEVKVEEFFSPEVDIPVFGCDSTSPIVRNQTTPIKMKRYSNFPYVTNKVITINRVVKLFSLSGIEKLDFLYHLTAIRNCPGVVSIIFNYLSAKDLDSVVRVSKTWKEILVDDTSTYDRWKHYKSGVMLRKENLSSPKKEGSPGWRTRAGPFSPLQSIQNEIRPQRSSSSSTPRASPPVSPQSARFRSFQKAAKTLKKGERLLPCPKCFFPSHDHGSPTVQCSRSGCRHRFCVWCRNEIISGVSHDCPPLYTPRPQRSSSYKIAAVGSKTCKRKLRRLALDL